MRTKFSSEEVDKLRQNPNVFSCTENSVNYTFEFKKRALELHKEGVYAREIWRRAGFDLSRWRHDYCKSTLSDWRKIVKKHGINGLLKVGGVQYDRGPTKVDVDTFKRQELQIKYLKAENDFLARLRAKRAERNSGRVRSTDSYEN